MHVTVRRAGRDDETVLARLSRPVQELHVAARPDCFHTVSETDVTEWYRLQLLSPDTRVWIAEAGSSPVGFIVSLLHERPATPLTCARRWCEIDALGVNPEWQQKGVGRLLVTAAVAAAQADGVQTVEASCWSFNQQAQNAFRKLGFVPRIVRLERQAGVAAAGVASAPGRLDGS